MDIDNINSVNNIYNQQKIRRHTHLTGFIKGALSGLRQFLALESPLKMMKKAFYFTSKALFVLKIFKFLSLLFGHVSKRLN